MLELMGVEEASFIGPAPPGRTPLEEDLSLELPRSLLTSSARLFTALEVEGLGGVIASSARTSSGAPFLERS